MENDLRTLYNEKLKELQLSSRQLAERLGGRYDYETVKRRLKSGGLPVNEIAHFVEALKIDPDALLRALLPDLPDAHSTVTEWKNLKMQVVQLEDELKVRRSGAVDHLGLAADITASGRWAVGILPNRSGPSADAEVLTGTRLAVTPVRPDLIPPGETVRSALLLEFGEIIRDRAVFLADHVRPRPKPPIPVDDSQVVYLSIPGFTADRPPAQSAVPLPRLGVKSVAVVALTQTAWRENVTAVAARALGWGVQNTSSIGRVATPVKDGDRDLFIESMNKVRNDGLNRYLLSPPDHTFIHHAGREVTGEFPERHSLVELAASEFRDQLPFIVLLRESDRIIARQERMSVRYDTGEPRFPATTWEKWRNELTDAVESLDSNRMMILDVDLPWDKQDELDGPPADVEVRNRAQWGRSAKLAQKIINQLFSLGTVGSSRPADNMDPEAERVLRAARMYI